MEARLSDERFDRFTMNNGFIELRDVAALDDFLAQSNGDPVIIFKHSDACGISARPIRRCPSLSARSDSSPCKRRVPFQMKLGNDWPGARDASGHDRFSR